MITFRVSADDSPILAKQFEPQFEANDLLQMHNRNFVINMVINGEKTPAFSARTLNLPPVQADNTEQIIEHSRRIYSRNRTDVEDEINKIIQPQTPAPQQPRQPTPKQWPINAHTNVITPDKVTTVKDGTPRPTPGPTPQSDKPPRLEQPPTPALETGEQAAKKKRRRRKKKPGESSERREEATVLPAPVIAPSSEHQKSKPSSSEQPLPTKEGHETEIRLR